MGFLRDKNRNPIKCALCLVSFVSLSSVYRHDTRQTGRIVLTAGLCVSGNASKYEQQKEEV